MKNLIIVRGGGDLATGTIYKLYKCGFPVLVLEVSMPSAIRRNVAFSEAVYEGTQKVEDVTCYLAHSPEEAEAYWGLVLCKYGIEYVDDPATGKKIPTCHRSSFDSIMEDSDFEQALENADPNDSVMRRTKAIIQSMTIKERENPQILNASRKKRIAAGCGMKIEDVNRLLKQFDQTNKLMKQFAGPKGAKKLAKFGGGKMPF